MPCTRRRLLVAAAATLPLAAFAQQRAALADPLRFGVDRGLADAGLARALVRAFGRDTGIAVKTEPAPSSALLEALDRAEVDLTLTDAPALEDKLLAAGLAHDGRVVANAQFVLIGPAPEKKQPDPLTAGGGDIVEALRMLHAASVNFLSANDGSGTHLLEQSLWRAAQRAPAAPWYQPAKNPSTLVAEARAAGAWAVVEKAVWAGQGGAPQAPRFDGDARLAVPVRVLRPFRARHPAAKIFSEWLGGPRGRAAARAVRGFV